MKQMILAVLLLVLATEIPVMAQGDRVVVSFIAQNAYGNNLYIDNVTIGTQYNSDVAMISLNNIPADTNYTIGSSSPSVLPRVSVANVGLTDIATPFTVTFTATPGGYTSTKAVNSLGRGQLQEVTFDELTIPVSTPMHFTLTANLTADENRANDTLRQYTITFPGVQRNVLLEEWTSSTCAPCAANNPTIDAFIQSKFDSLVAVKYHVGWPSPGNDPMYLHNPTQSYDRRYYYGVNAVPHIWMDGEVTPSYPYSTPQSLPDAFGSCINEATPISISVTDTRMPDDTIKADVTVTILAPLRAGSYKLRVEAVERHVHYSSPPGSNGETDFFDVFRRSYPTSDGTPIPTSMGTHTFSFKYKRDVAVWVDSMIYTAVFVQNDMTKEVSNCAKARHVTGANALISQGGTPTLANRERCIVDPSPSGTTGTSVLMTNPLDASFNFEFFEGGFPPAGWRRANPDNGITWEGYSGVSGPAFGGNKAVKIDFYSYSTTGQTDTLFSPVYTGLRSADSLKFDWAYAQYSSSYNDRLIVKLSKDGGVTFPYVVFDRAGAALATAPTTTSPFVPTSSSQWGRFAYSLNGVVSVEPKAADIPMKYNLAQNYPNPFNPETSIKFAVPKEGFVSLKVFDITGKEVLTGVNEVLQPGYYNVQIDASHLSSGIYFYKLSVNDFTETKKMTLLK